MSLFQHFLSWYWQLKNSFKEVSRLDTQTHFTFIWIQKLLSEFLWPALYRSVQFITNGLSCPYDLWNNTGDPQEHFVSFGLNKDQQQSEYNQSFKTKIHVWLTSWTDWKPFPLPLSFTSSLNKIHVVKTVQDRQFICAPCFLHSLTLLLLEFLKEWQYYIYISSARGLQSLC